MFGNKKAAAVDEAPAESYQDRRRRELLADIQRTKEALDSINRKLSMFAQKNFIFVNGARCWNLGRITGVPAAEAELRTLERARDDLLTQWHTILHEHASLVSRK